MNKININTSGGLSSKADFEVYLEETKRAGLELLLALQTFTMNPEKKTLDSAFDLIVNYKILSDTTALAAETHQMDYLKELNLSLGRLMNTLSLREVYNNITEKNMADISRRFSLKTGRKRLFSDDNFLPALTAAG